MANHPNRSRVVRLIRLRSDFLNVDDGFVVLQPGYEGAVDETKEEIGEYRLPRGYEVARSTRDELEIFDAEGHVCDIVMHRPSGRPQLISSAGQPVLRRPQGKE